MTASCVLCNKVIDVGVAAVSVVGGQFPKDDPDFFFMDEEIMKESHAHLACLLDVVKDGVRARNQPISR